MKFIIKYIYILSRAFWLLLKPLSVGVRILLIRDQKILLVKHVYENRWYLPGGMVERNETLEQAARREALEEVGAQVRELALFGAYTNRKERRFDHIVVYISKDFDVSGVTDDEIEQWEFFDLQALPDKISPGSGNRIQEFLDGETKRFGDW